jgi:hypothetical protein
MIEKVAIATVHGKTYFLIVNKLKEQKVLFTSLVSRESIPPKILVVIATMEEKHY